MRLPAALYALLALPLHARAFYNVTYNSNDTALTYSPSAWMDWPAAGCLSWPIGQWTRTPGSITLNFQGVAVYAYGLFDDNVYPIYTVRVDDDVGAQLGYDAIPTSQRCAPLYSKTDLQMGNHTIVFTLTNERPNDVKDLSFQGFIVTVPEEGDIVSTGNNNGTNTNNNNQNDPPKKKNHTAVIAGAVAGVVVIALIIASIIFFMRRRNEKGKNPAIANGKVPNNNNPPPMGQYYPNPNPNSNAAGVPDPSVPPPVPFMYQAPQTGLTYQPPPGASPWSATPDQNQLYPSPVPTPLTNASTPPPTTNNNNGGYVNYYSQPPVPTPSPPIWGNQPPQQQPQQPNTYYNRPTSSGYGIGGSSTYGESSYTGGTSDIVSSYVSSPTQPSSSTAVPMLMTKAEPSNAHINVAAGMRPSKGGVDPNATGVRRHDSVSQAGAAPPEYMP